MDMINLKNNMLMNKKKSLYEAPTTKVLVVRFEGMVCTSPNGTNSSNRTEYLISVPDDYDEL